MSAPARAQNGDSFLDADKSTVRYTETAFSSKLDCRDLVSRAGVEYSILFAELRDGEPDVPDHCRVTGVIAPEIIFEVNMPARWNGRFYMYGNGGFAGESPASKADVRNQALRHGFATAYTNTGHDSRREPGATFAYNNLQKTVDYLFRAVHLTAVYSKQLIAGFYDQAPAHSYWDGCSMGGRQGMVSAQRFPHDFDGIVAGAPAFDFTGTMLSYVWNSQVTDGASFRQEKMALLSERVYARCDADDGVEDGLITDPRDCDFDPARHLPRCGGSDDRDDCFTADEITRLEKLYDGPQRGGQKLYPGVPPGAEVLAPLRAPGGEERRAHGWEPWLQNGNGPVFQALMVGSYLKYLHFEVDDADYDWRQYPFEVEPEGIDRETAHLLDAKAADMSRFKARGGKMITYFGWADAAINPMPMVGYYEGLDDAMGSSPHDFYRLFMVPGMFHCDGGAGADQMDVMTAVIEWVEAGKAPGAITGYHVDGGAVKFSRPQCPYPQTAHYKGSGSPAAGDNFECALPR
ncbi:MAG: tannase/feruloyl esterase family alpha/beta hydrolase [Woeseia sp.]